MSMQTDCIYGYGFTISVSDETIVEFIKNHEETIAKLGTEGKKVLDYVKINDTYVSIKEELFDYQISSDSGIYGIIADVMREETGLNIEYRHGNLDYDDEEVIIMPEMLPWNFNDVSRNITRQELTDIFKEIMSEIGIQGEPDYQRVEYYG